MTRLVLMSDTHTRTNFVVPDGDIVVHSGDATFRGDHAELWDFARWYGRFPHEHKVLVAGNHDWGFEKKPEVFRKMMLDNGITYLEDSGVELGGLKFYGSPWQPEFGNWAFNLSRMTGELSEKWALIPDDTQVLVTHGPPRGILDLIDVYGDPEHVGCWDLRQRVDKLEHLKLHVFGHIHSAYGVRDVGGKKFVNAAVCDENYDPTNAPVVVDL